ncbi:MAG: GntR family transcriptional regulator [Rhodobacteraceae bacterium]|nr:GntR family transcriptional regulator [Paracoccaceae bacterium]
MLRRNGKNQALVAKLELRKMILSGDFAAGERLFESAVSERLGLSRTPVREALNDLAHEGLLERLANGGAMVRMFSFDDVVDAIEIRGLMEGLAARSAAIKGADPDSLAVMGHIVAELDQVVDGDDDMDFTAYAELNARFHALLSDMAGSETIRREVTRATGMPFASPSAFLDVQAEIREFRRSLIVAQAQHHGILDAIAARDGGRAEQIAREHARLALKNLEYVMTHDRSLIDRVPGLALVTA